MSEKMLLRVVRFVFSVTQAVSRDAAAALGERLFFSPRRWDRPAREHEWLEAADEFQLELGAQSLMAWSWGRPSDPVVLLMHGWEGRGAQLAALAEPLVAAGYRVITVDAPGHGESPGRSSTFFSFVDVVAEMDLQFGPLHAVVAHSFGCAGTTYAMSRGAEVSRVVFIAGPMSLSRGTQTFARIVGLSDDVLARMKKRIERRFGTRFEDLEMSLLAPNMKTPLLLIHDREDDNVRFSDAEKIAAWWPSARLIATEGLGHSRILRNADIVAAVTSFISERVDDELVVGLVGRVAHSDDRVS